MLAGSNVNKLPKLHKKAGLHPVLKMEGPGMTLFQGAGSIHINNSAQDRLEEQEEIEDQKRRNEELKHKLVNAFDDLLDEDEASSVNSSHSHVTLDNNAQTKREIVNGMNNYSSNQYYKNNDQLNVLYEMRVKECQQLAAQMEMMESEIESLRARLAATVSNHDKANLSLQESHQLLATSKHKLLELEQRVTAVTEKLIASEEEKKQLKLEVLSSSISLQEAQQRLQTLQVAHSHDIDTLLKGQQDRDQKIERYKKHEAELRASLEEYKGVELQLSSQITMLENQVKLLSCSFDRDQLEKYKEENKRLQEELYEYKGVELQLNSQITMLQSQVKSLSCSFDRDQLEKYKEENKRLQEELYEARQQLSSVSSSRDAATREIKDLRTVIQKQKDQFQTLEKEYIERIQKEKEHVLKSMKELTSCREELETSNKRICELQKEFADRQKQFTEKLDKYLKNEKNAMHDEISACAQCEKLLKQIPRLEEQLSQCTLKLATQESNKELMKELQEKAQFFQQYIKERHHKLRSLRTVGTSTNDEPLDVEHPKGGSETDELAKKTELLLQEKGVRDQIAEKYTLEIKTLEMNCSRRIKRMESQHYQTIMALKELVESKAQQVDTLKEKVLSEKAVATEMLDAKEKDISLLIKEHNGVLQQFQQYREKVAKLSVKFENKNKKIAALKQELLKWKEKVKMSAYEHETIKKKYTELNNICKETEKKCSQLQNELKIVIEKYNICKKTVLTYKNYINKKDEHIRCEMYRIQDEYRDMFTRLKAQLNEHQNCRQKLGMKDPTVPDQHFPQYDYSAKIKELSEEFAKITQFKEPESDQ